MRYGSGAAGRHPRAAPAGDAGSPQGPAGGGALTPEEKARLRRLGEAARENAGEAVRRAWSGEICRRLCLVPEIRRAQVILSYAAMGAEADLGAFHRWAEGEGKRLVFPVTGPGGAMDAWEAAGPGAWRRGRFGIQEPDPRLARAAVPGEIEVVLVPCVGFDRACRRLGRGGGYYDRYLPRCPGAFCLGVAFECQRLTELVPEDPWDVPLQAVVTEKGVYGP